MELEITLLLRNNTLSACGFPSSFCTFQAPCSVGSLRNPGAAIWDLRDECPWNRAALKNLKVWGGLNCVSLLCRENLGNVRCTTQGVISPSFQRARNELCLGM